MVKEIISSRDGEVPCSNGGERNTEDETAGR